MLRFAVVVLLCVAALVSGGTLPAKARKHLRPSGRIVGGELVTIQDNPWQISLRIFGLHTCGGSLIAPDVVLTAAHCVEGLIGFFEEVVSGTDNLGTGGTVSEIKESIIHEAYDGLSNDIAVILLNTPLTLDETTNTVPLTDAEPVAGDTVKVTGWGVLNEEDLSTPNELYGVEITVVDRAECAADYADVEDAAVDDTMVCAGVPEGGKDSCSGDSGGPLTEDGVLVGIVSWGLGCAEVGYPGVYTNVNEFRQWITDTVGV